MYTLDKLPGDIIVLIICAGVTGSHDDYHTIMTFKLLCKSFNDAMNNRYHEIIDKYTILIHYNTLTMYQYCGTIHRDNDLPAVISENGSLHWYRYGLRHRDNDKPAIIDANGDCSWYHEGKCHREGDKPAIMRANGTKMWYQHGKQHRDNDRPAVIGYESRCVRTWIGGTVVNERPDYEWYIHGHRHRDDSLPAVIFADGNKEWWVRGTLVIIDKFIHLNVW